MPIFLYKAKTPRGVSIEGEMEADSRQTVIEKMRSQSLVILDVKEKQKSILSSFKHLNPFSKNKVGMRELILFTRQFLTLLKAGVAIRQSLSILSEQIENKNLREIVTTIKGDIEMGMSLSDAMRRHKIFSELYVNMMQVGELGGMLDTMLERISGYLETSQAIRNRVKSAMIYPAVILCFALGVTVFLLAFVVPSFSEMFMSAGVSLPLPTQILIAISNLVKNGIVFAIIGAALAAWGANRYIQTPKGRIKFDTYLLKIPLFGKLNQKTNVAQFSKTLSTLIASGVAILQAMEIVAKTISNVIIKNIIVDARDKLKEGGRLSEELSKSPFFPPMVTTMAAIGEETGNLDGMLEKISDFYDQEIQITISTLISLMEPMIIAFMGLVVGGIVIAMFLPIFEMSQITGG